MDKEKRSRLRNIVTQARNLIESDIRAQLRRLGINEDGSVRPLWELRFLSRDELKLRGKILSAIQKEKAGETSPQEAFDRYVRHVGFTFINRIAALRAMEVRGLIKETVLRRTRYGGMSRREYEIAEKHKEFSSEELLKASLLDAFREVSEEIKVLFDINDEYSLLFPEPRTLRKLIEFFIKDIPEEDWKEDDIIGWIYQYYNEEARAKFKREERKPKADDIPVKNQFYTPHWVVRALVDNTLGRLWLEMNERCPKLGDPVKRTREQLENPSGDTLDEFCSYLVPLSQEPPPMKKKRVREIKVLDPACGSGHFLVYAFDVLYRMYREDEPDTPVEEIPRLILENNLFGIDIDLRAVQLAALSLYLKARSYNSKFKIAKINLVCADARITDGEVRKVFLERFADDPELQMIFAKIFEDLEYTYEIGSLLKVRKPFERLLERRRQEGVQAILFPRIAGQTVISRTGKIEGQTELAMSVSEEEGQRETVVISKAATLDQMIGALREFEKEAMEKRDMGTLLFATEAEKSVGLVALLTERYDVVLMNPAYGEMPPKTKEYVTRYYPRTKNDYYAAFIEQAIDLCDPHGFVGMLTSSTFMYLKSFLKVREEILCDTTLPLLLLEFGIGILDGATVRTAATVVRKTKVAEHLEESTCLFCRLTGYVTDEKQVAFENILSTYLTNGHHELLYQVKLDDLKAVPGKTYVYWASSDLRNLFRKYPPLDRDQAKKHSEPKIADAVHGGGTMDDKRFIRRFWEVKPETLGQERKWVPFAKGEEYANYYSDITFVVNWEHEGREIKDYKTELCRRKVVWGFLDEFELFYFKEGLTWQKVSHGYHGVILGRRHRYLPPHCIFGLSGPTLFFHDSDENWPAMGVLNSSLTWTLMLMLTSTRDWTNGYIAALPWAYKKIKHASSIGSHSREIYDLLRENDTGNEISTIFIKPWILQVLHGFSSKYVPTTGHPFADAFYWSGWDSVKKIRSIVGTHEASLSELAALSIKREQLMRNYVDEIQRKIDEEVYRLYGIGEEDQRLIQKELPLRSRRISFSGVKKKKSENDYEEPPRATSGMKAKVQDHVARFISFYIKNTLESDPDGIVPLSELVREIVKHLAIDFGRDQIDVKEREIKEILGKSLEEWIVTDYFDFHVNLYKRRPIFWHLTSANFAKGRQRKGAFNCFLHYHKIGRHTIPNIRGNYLRNEIDRAQRTVDRLKRELQKAKDAKDRVRERRLSVEFEEALSVLDELHNFDKALEEVHNFRLQKTKLGEQPRWVNKAIAEVRDDGWTSIIDYGVRVNIEPLKEAKVLHKAADKVK